jgi:hypothetical protein
VARSMKPDVRLEEVIPAIVNCYVIDYLLELLEILEMMEMFEMMEIFVI